MWQRVGASMLVMAAVIGLVVSLARAADETHEGKVVSVGQDKITVLDDRDGDNDTFAVTAETKITKNGKPAKLIDIQPGDKAKITASGSGTNLVAKEIAARAPE